jgi:penicillin-binding protein 2
MRLAHSNNVFFHKLGEMLGFQRITEYAQEFGLGEKAGLDIPGESAGRYPSAPPKQGGVGFLAYCGTDVEVTPLQMAAVISTIANGGTLYALQYPRTPRKLPRSNLSCGGALTTWLSISRRSAMAWRDPCFTGRAAPPTIRIFPFMEKPGPAAKTVRAWAGSCPYAGELQSKYVVVVLLRGGRMMYGPHAAEIAGHFYRDLMQKEHPTQASRDGSLTSR